MPAVTARTVARADTTPAADVDNGGGGAGADSDGDSDDDLSTVSCRRAAQARTCGRCQTTRSRACMCHSASGAGKCGRALLWLLSAAGVPKTPNALEVCVYAVAACVNTLVCALYMPSFMSAHASTATTTVSASGRVHTRDPVSAMQSASGSFGTLGSINVALALVPVTRFSLLHVLTGISVERGITFHRWLMRAGFLCYTLHAVTLVLAYAPAGEMWTQSLDGISAQNGSGWLSYFGVVLLFVTSLEAVRRRAFETFYRAHWAFTAVFVVFGAIHQGANIVALVVPLLLLAFDLAHRVVVVCRARVVVRRVTVLPCDVVRIELVKPRGFRYHSGQFAFICIPALSLWQWHPFSFSSSPHSPTITLHVRALGDWTRDLLRYVHTSTRAASASASAGGGVELAAEQFPTVWLEGPYGDLTFPLANYRNVLLVSGGIGITPLQSVFNSLLHHHTRHTRHTTVRAQSKTNAQTNAKTEKADVKTEADVEANTGAETGTQTGRAPRRVKFVWSVRDAEMVRSLRPQEQLDAAAVELELARTPTATAAAAADRDADATARATNAAAVNAAGIFAPAPAQAVGLASGPAGAGAGGPVVPALAAALPRAFQPDLLSPALVQSVAQSACVLVPAPTPVPVAGRAAVPTSATRSGSAAAHSVSGVTVRIDVSTRERDVSGAAPSSSLSSRSIAHAPAAAVEAVIVAASTVDAAASVGDAKDEAPPAAATSVFAPVRGAVSGAVDGAVVDRHDKRVGGGVSAAVHARAAALCTADGSIFEVAYHLTDGRGTGGTGGSVIRNGNGTDNDTGNGVAGSRAQVHTDARAADVDGPDPAAARAVDGPAAAAFASALARRYSFGRYVARGRFDAYALCAAFRQQVLADADAAAAGGAGRKPNPIRVALLTCGPAGLVNAVIRAAVDCSTAQLQFDVHVETFEF